MTAPKRKKVPLRAQLEAALRQLGHEPHEFELDHQPPLGLRPIAPDGTDWEPSQHDARYLVWLPKPEHRAKTSGKPHDVSDGDTHRIAKAKRITKDQEAFRARLLAKANGEPRQTSKWPKRPMRGRGFDGRPKPQPSREARFPEGSP